MSAVDIVIATYNRHERLNRCLDALARQDRRDFTVIVVDDGSSPAAESTIRPDLFDTLDLRILRTPNAGPGNARNTGVVSGEAPFILFIDDDIDAAEDLVSTHLTAMETHGGPCASIGPLRAPPDWRPQPWTCWEAMTLDRAYQAMRRGQQQPGWRTFYTGNVMLRREDFLAAGGFDLRFRRAEDIELAARLDELGVAFAFTWKATGWHYSERSLESWLRIASDYGRLQVAIDRLHPRLGWLRTVQEELRGASLVVRAGRRATDIPVVSSALSWLALRAGAVLFSRGKVSLAMKALSFAYHTEYRRALREALRRPRRALWEFRGDRPPLPAAGLPVPSPHPRTADGPRGEPSAA